MKKSDLRTGMWVKYRNGDMKMVLLGSIHKVGNGDFLVGRQSWAYVEDHKNDLAHNDCKNLDIIEAWMSPTTCDLLDFNESRFSLIWKRKEAKNLTRSEAEAMLTEKLGIEVKITKEAVKIW